MYRTFDTGHWTLQYSGNFTVHTVETVAWTLCPPFMDLYNPISPGEIKQANNGYFYWDPSPVYELSACWNFKLTNKQAKELPV